MSKIEDVFNDGKESSSTSRVRSKETNEEDLGSCFGSGTANVRTGRELDIEKVLSGEDAGFPTSEDFFHVEPEEASPPTSPRVFSVVDLRNRESCSKIDLEFLKMFPPDTPMRSALKHWKRASHKYPESAKNQVRSEEKPQGNLGSFLDFTTFHVTTSGDPNDGYANAPEVSEKVYQAEKGGTYRNSRHESYANRIPGTDACYVFKYAREWKNKKTKAYLCSKCSRVKGKGAHHAYLIRDGKFLEDPTARHACLPLSWEQKKHQFRGCFTPPLINSCFSRMNPEVPKAAGTSSSSTPSGPSLPKNARAGKAASWAKWRPINQEDMPKQPLVNEELLEILRWELKK